MKSQFNLKLRMILSKVPQVDASDFIRSLPKMIRTKMKNKWNEFKANQKRLITNIYIDYKIAFLNAKQSAVEEPLKNLILVPLGLGSFLYCVQTNPDDTHFRELLLNHNSNLLTVDQYMQKPTSADRIRLLERAYSRHTLKWINLGLCSLMCIDDHSTELGAYKYMCPYLSLSLLDLKEKIVDFGFVGKWWILDKYMEDYDINEDELVTVLQEKINRYL